MLEKISDLPEHWQCDHPEHTPPSMVALSPGVYKHVCPKCKLVVTFVVRNNAPQPRCGEDES
jgi:hypothetical protein